MEGRPFADSAVDVDVTFVNIDHVFDNLGS
jgi:hypothetical protein